MFTAAPTSFVLLEHKTEPLRKRSGESDVEAMLRIITSHAVSGWQLVEACGDEIGVPILIFRRLPAGAPMPRYAVEEIPAIRGQEEIQTVTDYLWKMHDLNWLPVCVLDSPISTPIAVFQLSLEPIKDIEIQVIRLPMDLFEKGAISIVYELLDQQITRNLSLKCIVHGGLSPILVLISKDVDTNYNYLVDHARGGIFSNQFKTLADLVNERSSRGWEVCGAFEDSFLWPCVVFRRTTSVPPVIPMEVRSN